MRPDLVYYDLRRHADAMEQARKALELDSRYDRARHILGSAYLQEGMHAEALAELKQAPYLPPGEYESMLGYAYAVMGQRDEALKTVAKLEKDSQQRYVSP